MYCHLSPPMGFLSFKDRCHDQDLTTITKAATQRAHLGLISKFPKSITQRELYIGFQGPSSALVSRLNPFPAAKMPKFFCDYCDVYLTHDSMSVRKAHNAGRNHLRNVVEYYQQIGHEKAQSVIDSITSSYAESGQANPMLSQTGPMGFGPPPGFPPPLPGK